MSDMQAIPPPPGGDQNRGPDTYGAIIPFTILSTATVVARMYARINMVHNVGWDDYTILLAQFMNILNLIFQILAVQHGLGRHMYFLPFQNIVDVGLYYHVIEVLYVLAAGVIKISACLFLLRIMNRGTTNVLRWSLYILMGVLLVLSSGTAIVILIQCIPVQAGWDPRIKGKCWSYPQILVVGYTQNAWGILSDLACAGFPIIILRKLQIDTRNKYALYFIMGLGVVTSICSVIKMIYLGDLANGDFTYNGVDVNIWGMLEVNIGTIACSIPALRPLFKSLRERSNLGSYLKRRSRNAPTGGSGSWRDSTIHKLDPRSRNSHHRTLHDAASDSEQILPDDGRGIRKTTDVTLSYHEAGGDRRANDGAIEMT
ncbi:hypothetical protein MMC07_009510 [Pseudocyphellaria aurata]|nr:hypothetical protein [Pseudocyphellaria aurata]